MRRVKEEVYGCENGGHMEDGDDKGSSKGQEKVKP